MRRKIRKRGDREGEDKDKKRGKRKERGKEERGMKGERIKLIK